MNDLKAEFEDVSKTVGRIIVLMIHLYRYGHWAWAVCMLNELWMFSIALEAYVVGI